MRADAFSSLVNFGPRHSLFKVTFLHGCMFAFVQHDDNH